MKLATKLKFAVAMGLLAAVPVIMFIDGQTAAAHEGESHQSVAQAQAPTPAPSQAPAATYRYTAQAGDSYSAMARKAIQTYGKKFGVKLSHAKIIFAETNLAQQAGSPLLNLGQGVTIDEAKVKSWVEQATKLTPAQEAAWNEFVPSVDFNTDAVGQAR